MTIRSHGKSTEAKEIQNQKVLGELLDAAGRESVDISSRLKISISTPFRRCPMDQEIHFLTGQ